GQRVREWESTDRWILRVLSEARVGTLEHAANVIRERANEIKGELRQKISSSDRRHAFVIAGWSLEAETPSAKIYAITNALDADLEFSSEHARDEFTEMMKAPCSPSERIMLTVGARAPRDALNPLWQVIQKDIALSH